MSDMFEALAEHHAALNRAVLLRDMRLAQDRAERTKALRDTLWIGIACLMLIGGAAVMMEIAR